MTVHKPVLISESIEGLNLENKKIAVDATLGGGGHSLEIIKKISPDGMLIALDRDRQAIESFRNTYTNLNFGIKKERIKLVRSNFSNIKNVLFDQKINSVDAILADLGISSDQIESGERGFSFKKDASLDMRMNQGASITAREIVNTYSKDDLENILWKYGEEKYAAIISEKIVEKRNENPIETTQDLVGVIDEAVPGKYKRKKINQATRTFQAIRIEVNQELANLEEFLRDGIDMLKTGGRFAVISFHSLEDRIVKNIFRENARGCICPPDFPVCRCTNKPKIKIINKKPIISSEDEIEKNPRSRSAKLRIAEKI